MVPFSPLPFLYKGLDSFLRLDHPRANYFATCDMAFMAEGAYSLMRTPNETGREGGASIPQISHFFKICEQKVVTQT